MRLRRNEYCPIHKSISCCGRGQTPYARRLQPGIRRIDDPHHPRGYREFRSPAEMRKLLNRKIVEQDRKCAICHEEFTEYNDVVPDHRNPKGMGGAYRSKARKSFGLGRGNEYRNWRSSKLDMTRSIKKSYSDPNPNV